MSTALATIAANVDILTKAEAAARSSTSFGTSFMKFTQDGEFLYGQEENTVDDTEQWAVNPLTIAKGFICWKSKEVVDELMSVCLSTQPDIIEATLSDHSPYKKKRDGWSKQMTVDMRSMETGDEVMFKSSSYGGIQAIGKLLGAVIERMKMGEEDLIPIITLSGGSYDSKEYDKEIAFPVFAIEEWLSEADLAATFDTDIPVSAASDDDPPFDVDDNKNETPAIELKTRKRSGSTAGSGRTQRKLAS